MKCVYCVCTVCVFLPVSVYTVCLIVYCVVHCAVCIMMCVCVCVCLSVCFKQTTLVECIRTLLTKVCHVIHHTLYNTSIQFCDLLLELNQ